MRVRLLYILLAFTGFYLSSASLCAQTLASAPRSAPTYFFDNFEQSAAFVNYIPEWTTIDLDSSPTWGIEGVKFPLQFAPMSFIVFCPDSTSPPLTDTAFKAFSGNKYATCFAATDPPNSDWLISPLLHAVDQSQCSFYIRSFAGQFGLERYRVGVSTTDGSPSSFTFITGENYLTAPSGVWTKKKFDLSSYDGLDIYVGIQCVSDNSFILMIDDFEFSTAIPDLCNVSGLVTDAVTGRPIAGATVSARGKSTLTDENGNYLIQQVPVIDILADFEADVTSGVGPLTVNFTDKSNFNLIQLVCSADNYINYVNEQVNVIPGGNIQLNISLSPVLLEGEMRFVLNWTDKPSDLDSHLNTPVIGGQTHHIYYNNPGSATMVPYAALDYDVTQGFGPETTTIYQLQPGTYQFYIQNFSQSPTITESQAVLQIYNQNGLFKTIYSPETGVGNYWYVCDIDGGSGEVEIKNSIQTTVPGGRGQERDTPTKTTPVPESREWLWNFGDGNISTLPNPTHTYMQKGKYTVSLQVNDGIRQAAQTRTNYINVGTVGLAENKVLEFTVNPIPAADFVLVTSPETILKCDLLSISGKQLMGFLPYDKSIKINISALPRGFYLVRIETAEGSAVRKIVKQ